MAQATISGVVEFAGVNNVKIVDQVSSNAARTQKTSRTAELNQWTTSELRFQGTEDLGGGLRASFTINSGINNNATAATGSVLGTRDTNLALSGGFGTVRVGRFVPGTTMGFHGFSGAASTSTGSIYGIGSTSARFARAETGATTVGSAGANADAANPALTGGSFERNDNLIQYTSPAFNGLTVTVHYGENKADSSALLGDTSAKQQGVGVTYAKGPLSIGAGTNTRKITTIGTANVNQTGAGADLDWIGASYNFGVATVFATNVQRKDTSTNASGVKITEADISVNAMGVSVPMGAFTINASTYSGKNKARAAADDNTKLSGHQLSVRYALSKRTTVYALVGENKIARDGAATATETRKETRNMVGLMHSF